VVGEAALLAADLRQRHPQSADLAWDRHLEVAGLLQLVEILLKEAILTVVGRGTLGTTREELVGQH
jgi:hypothetical protein